MLGRKVKHTATPKFQPGITPGRVPRYYETEEPNSKTADGKRRQLVSILESEKRKEERGKLGCILIDRLIKKFGSKHSGLITFFVEEFLTSHNDINKDDIAKLEKEIANTLDMKAKSRPNSSLGETGSTGNDNGNRNVSRGEDKPTAVTTFNNPAVASKAAEELSRPPSGKEWEVINSYQLLKGEEKERQEREAAYLKKLNFRKSLDDHLRVAHTIQRGDHESDKEYAERIANDIKKYHDEEKNKMDKIKKKNHDESDLRMQQIQEKQRRAAQEKAEAMEMDRRNQELNLQKQREEQEKLARIRREKLESQERILQENRENERLRQLARQKDAELDQRQMQEYASKLDREAVERENAFQKRMEKSANNGQKFATEGAGKAQRDAQLREEQLLIREQLRKEENDIAKELKKKEDQRIRTHMQLVENQRQLEKKQREQMEQTKNDITFAERARAEAEAFQAAEKERQRLRLLKQNEYRAMLDAQVSEQKRRNVRNDGMAPVEKEINMPTLREAVEDPQMLSRVMHRMRLTKAAQQQIPKASNAPF